MIIYNVTISIEPVIQKQWLAYMKEKHIPNVMKTGCFEQYKFSKLLTRQRDETGLTYCVQYFCSTKQVFENYEKHYADNLRKEHTALFGDKAIGFRSVLELMQEG